MCVPLPHKQDTNSADTAYETVCLRILELCNGRLEGKLDLVIQSVQAGREETRESRVP
jgi:hypothetical protein